MLRYWCLVLSLWSAALNAADFSARLEQQEKNPETAVASLLLQVEQTNDAEDWLLLSHGYVSLLNKDGAINSVNKALQIGLKPELEVAALKHKALIYGLLFRDSARAIETLQLAEKHVEYLDHPNKPQLQTSIFESFAQAYNQLGQIPKAVTYADAAIAIAVANQLPAEELQARIIAGRLALQQNNFAFAQQHLAEGLRLAQDLGKASSLGSIHLRLGMAYHKLQQFSLALSHFQQAEQLFQMPERRNQLITALLNKAQTLQQQGELKLAATELQQAMTLAKEMNDPTLIAQAYYGQAELALANQAWQDAEILLAKAQQLYTQLRSTTMATETALAQVELALSQNQQEKAIAYLPKINDFKSLPLFLQEDYLQKSAKVYALQQQWQQAYQQAELANEVRFELDAEQQKQFMDSLQNSLAKQQLQKDLLQLREHLTVWQIGTLCALVCSLILALRLWYKHRHQAPRLIQDWLSFSKTIQTALKNQQLLQLQIIRSDALQSDNSLAIVELLASKHLVAASWQQQQLWLLWRDIDENALHEQAHQHLYALQHLLGKHWHSWQAELLPLMGASIKTSALNGLGHLIQLSFTKSPLAQAKLDFLTVNCSQTVPCNWHGEDVPADIQNALQLGLLSIHSHGLAVTKTA